MIPAVTKNSGLLKKLNDHGQNCCIVRREPRGPRLVAVNENRLTVRQKAQTSSDSEDGLHAQEKIGWQHFHLRSENAQTSSESEEV